MSKRRGVCWSVRQAARDLTAVSGKRPVERTREDVIGYIEAVNRIDAFRLSAHPSATSLGHPLTAPGVSYSIYGIADFNGREDQVLENVSASIHRTRCGMGCSARKTCFGFIIKTLSPLPPIL